MNFKYIGLIITLITLDTVGRILVKEAQEKNNSYYLGSAGIVYLCTVLALYYTFSLNDFARTAAYWDTGTVITSILVGKYLFGESYKIGEWVGFGCIVLGFVILASFSENKNESK